MRETRLSGSEGGETETNQSSLPPIAQARREIPWGSLRSISSPFFDGVPRRPETRPETRPTVSRPLALLICVCISRVATRVRSRKSEVRVRSQKSAGGHERRSTQQLPQSASTIRGKPALWHERDRDRRLGGHLAADRPSLAQGSALPVELRKRSPRSLFPSYHRNLHQPERSRPGPKSPCACTSWKRRGVVSM
jgi:hypothetical protein